MNVLLVDEVEKSRGEIVAMLQVLGHRVVAVETCVEGLTAFHENPISFDLVMTEQKTCGRCSGEVLCKEVRKKRAKTRTIITSYLAGESSEAVDAWLEKPFTQLKLEEILAQLC